MNRNLLRGKLVAQGESLGDLARELNISQQELNNKLSGRSEFRCSQIQTCIDHLKLTPSELMEIFFDTEVE